MIAEKLVNRLGDVLAYCQYLSPILFDQSSPAW